jgi:hypothetical protein
MFLMYLPTIALSLSLSLYLAAADIDPLLEASEPGPWAHDSDYKMCYLCNSAFTLVNRRHHCRHWYVCPRDLLATLLSHSPDIMHAV